MHAPELTGDYWGTQNLKRVLTENLTQAQKAKLIGLAMENKCPYKGSANNVDEGFHPSPSFRIDMVLKEPTIRKLMGCSPIKANEKPFCGLDGAER
jgi:hypothetical protein